MAINRRTFVRNIIAATSLLGSYPWASKPAFAATQPIGLGPGSVTDEDVIASGLDPAVINVSLIASLFDQPITVRLHSGIISDAITLGAYGVYRVRLTRVGTNRRFGLDLFQLELADGQGNKLASMGLADGATGTFTQYGVQAYVSSDRRSTAFLMQGKSRRSTTTNVP